MSTYYELQCPTCQEAGGFFSRQAWGWGNADIIETFKFLMAHVECRAVDLEYDRQSAIEVVGEHESNYGNKAWRAKFEENIESGRAADMWPRADEWEWMAASIAAKEPLSDAWAKWKERWRAARKEREGIT